MNRIQKICSYTLGWIILFAVSTPGFAQKKNNTKSSIKQIGTPVVKTYKPADYNAAPENFSVVQGNEGIMYFGNLGFIMEYDGVTWRKIKIKDGKPVVSLGKDEKGIIYVSAGNEFGYLAPDNNYTISYFSLSQQLETKDSSSENIGKVHVAKDYIYFQTAKYIFQYKKPLIIPKDKSIIFEKPIKIEAKTIFTNSYLADNVLFVQQDFNKLLQLDNNQLISFKYKSFLKSKTIAILPFEKNQVLVCTENALFTYRLKSGFFKFDTESDKFLDEILIVQASALPNAYIFATLNRGTFIIDKQSTNKKRRIIERFDKNSGLPTEQLTSLYPNPELNANLLWMTSAYGISRVHVNSAFRKVNEAMAVKDIILKMTRSDKDFYVRTLTELYYLKDTLDAFEFIKIKNTAPVSDWIIMPISTIADTKLKNDPRQLRKLLARGIKPKTILQNKLCIATKNGISFIDEYQPKNFNFSFQVVQKKVKKQAQTFLANSNKSSKGVIAENLYKSNLHHFRIYYTTKNGIGSISYQNETWVDEGKIEGINSSINHVAEDASGNLWILDKNKHLLYLQFNSSFQKLKIKDKDRGKRDSLEFSVLPNSCRLHPFDNSQIPELMDNGIYFINKKVFFATTQGLYTFDSNSKSFVPSSLLGNDYLDGTNLIENITVDTKNNLWVKTRNNFNLVYDFFELQDGGHYTKNSAIIRAIPQMIIENIYPDINSLIWVSSAEGLYIYNPALLPNGEIRFTTLIRKVTVGKDSVVFSGYTFEKTTKTESLYIANHQANERMHLDYKHNNISFEFAAPFFDDEFATQYSYVLEGPGDNAGWSSWSDERKVQFSNLRPGKYTFNVKALNLYGKESKVAQFKFDISPPWYRTWWATALYILVAMALIYGFVKFNTRRLLKEKERLEAIVYERTHELLKQKEEIELKNAQITGGINYASRIQAAMLPKTSELHCILKDYFVLFKPKEIVSGDFYWLAKKKEKIVVTAVDCTGHGVPGALMSMVGDSLLNQIVKDKNITRPELILEFMHKGVNQTLKQNENDSRDGMDMALIVIDEKTKTMEYAGAKNPLVYIQDDQMFAIRGDKEPIGGLLNDEKRTYTKHTISLEKPTTIYLYSDGYQDQFGGEEGNKFMSGTFKNLLMEIHHKPMKEQKEILENTLKQWMGKYHQIDDILVMGFNINLTNTKT